MITVLIPAHNEERIIGQCIESLLSQSYKYINIIISCDNCTDNTVIISKTYPVAVYETKNNKGTNKLWVNVLWTSSIVNPKKFKIQKAATSKSGRIPANPAINT